MSIARLGLALLCFFGAAAVRPVARLRHPAGQRVDDAAQLRRDAAALRRQHAGQGSSHLYVLTQWGFARAPISSTRETRRPTAASSSGTRAAPAAAESPLLCDCHQGANTMAAAQGPGGASRFISDWQPADQGGEPGDNNFSGLPAMVAMTNDNGNDRIRPAGRVARHRGAQRAHRGDLHAASKYFAYLPVKGNSVYMADMTSPTGNPSATNPMQTSFAIGWQSGTTPTRARGLSAAQVTIPGYSKHLLIGATALDQSPPHRRDQHVQRERFGGRHGPDAVHPDTGRGFGVVNNRIFVFTAEGGQGLNVYEFVPPSTLALGRDDRYGRAPARRARPAAVPDPVRPQVPGLELVVDQHLRHQVADAGRLAAAREVAPALRCGGGLVPGRGLRGASSERTGRR